MTTTPDYIVKTTANLVVGDGSSTEQSNQNAATASMTPGSLSANGMAAKTLIKYDSGTQYGVEITPRTLVVDGVETPVQFPNQRALSTATGSSVGYTTTSITVESTNSSFLNSFVDTINRQ